MIAAYLRYPLAYGIAAWPRMSGSRRTSTRIQCSTPPRRVQPPALLYRVARARFPPRSKQRPYNSQKSIPWSMPEHVSVLQHSSNLRQSIMDKIVGLFDRAFAESFVSHLAPGHQHCCLSDDCDQSCHGSFCTPPPPKHKVATRTPL